MKLITRFITLSILAAAIILPFFVKFDQGKPSFAMPTSADFIPDKILPDSLTGNESNTKTQSSNSSTGSKQTFYKWQDAQGNWHYGDTPPPGSQNLSSLQVDTNTNIIQGIKVDKEEIKPLVAGPSKPQMSDTLADGKLTIDDAVNVMNDAKAVRDMMESRNEALKAITNE